MVRKGAYASLFIAGLATVAVGCGSDSSDDVADAGRNLARAPDLQGAWVSTCDGFGVGPLQLSGKAYYAFEPLQYKKKIALYADKQCATQNAEVRYTGEFNIGNSDDLPEGQNRVDLVPKTIVVKATSQAGVDALNAAKLCGVSDWTINASRDVTAAAKQGDCLAERIEATQYDVYSLDDKTLRFGSAYLLGAPTKAESRPSKLNERVFQPSEKWE